MSSVIYGIYFVTTNELYAGGFGSIDQARIYLNKHKNDHGNFFIAKQDRKTGQALK